MESYCRLALNVSFTLALAMFHFDVKIMGHEEDLVDLGYGVRRPTITNYLPCRRAAGDACEELFSDQDRLEEAGNGRLEWRTGPVREDSHMMFAKREGGTLPVL